jgi:C1A family cysteine protease
MKKMSFMLVIMLVLSALAIAQNPQRDIDLIKQIQNLTRSATWEPAMTDLAYLTSEEFSKMCGLYPVLGYEEMNPEPEASRVLGSVDLRDQGVVTGIRNQAQCGSCWAFAMVACIEIVHGGNYDLSEQQLVSCCTSSSGCNGGYISSTADWVKSKGGIVTESVYPYTSGGGNTGTCKTVSGTKYNISAYSSCGSDAAIKSALNQGVPINTGMKVYDDFRYYKSGVYKHVSGSYLGGHAVCIVGYDDGGGYWIIKNSWGTGWGESGFFRMAYGECSVPWMAIAVRK